MPDKEEGLPEETGSPESNQAGALSDLATLSPMRVVWKRGLKKPYGSVIVTRISKWGNPYKVGSPGVPDNETAVRSYAADLLAGILPYGVGDVRRELRGKDLACGCPLDEPCHGNVLLGIANVERKEDA